MESIPYFLFMCLPVAATQGNRILNVCAHFEISDALSRQAVRYLTPLVAINAALAADAAHRCAASAASLPDATAIGVSAI